MIYSLLQVVLENATISDFVANESVQLSEELFIITINIDL